MKSHLSQQLILILKEQKKKRLRIRPYLNRRETVDNLSLAVISLDNKLFKNLARISKGDFDFLLNKIGPKIKRNDTNMRTAIPVSSPSRDLR